MHFTWVKWFLARWEVRVISSCVVPMILLCALQGQARPPEEGAYPCALLENALTAVASYSRFNQFFVGTLSVYRYRDGYIVRIVGGKSKPVVCLFSSNGSLTSNGDPKLFLPPLGPGQHAKYDGAELSLIKNIIFSATNDSLRIY